MEHVRLIITGDVQGVGFRAWTKRQAERLGLHGWVRNREDGTVETVAEGGKANLEKFIEFCRNGPEISWVKEVQVKWDQATGDFASFQIYA